MSPSAIRIQDDFASSPEASSSPVSRDIDSCGNRSRLRHSDDDEIHDLICVGFGPASLAIAVALHDALDIGDSNLCSQTPKVTFLERQPQFAWHAGMLLPGAKMQISFVKDLATLRNPRSEFTFINYLHRKGRLASFINLGTFLPQRVEYEDYFRWCAGWFDDVVHYDQTVERIDVGGRNADTGAVDYFNVTSRARNSDQVSIRKSRHVVIAVGGKPAMPPFLTTNHPRIMHSSQFLTNIENTFSPGNPPRSVAVVGGGQSAAEVFSNIPSRFPRAKSYLLIRGAALRPSDDSPFVNEVFDPDRVDHVYAQDPAVRAKAIALDKATNYSVVRMELLEHIYSTLYSYRVQYDSEEQWPHRILTHREVVGVEDSDIGGRPAVQLRVQNNSGAYYAHAPAGEDTLTVDLVVFASGYQRDSHEGMMESLRHLMPGGDEAGKRWSVRRDYGVRFEKGAVSPGTGVWLQGCNESTHGLSDTLLSVLATRAGRVVSSIFGKSHDDDVNGDDAAG